MNTFKDTLPLAPPGIVPDILSKIEALFQKTNLPHISVAMDDTKYGVRAPEIPNALTNIVYEDHPMPEESNSSIDEMEVFIRYDSDKDQEKGSRLSNQQHRIKGKGVRKKHTRSTAKHDCSIQRIVARFEYPSKTSLAPPQSTPCSPDAIESTANALVNIFSALTHSIYCISKYLAHHLPFPLSLVRHLVSNYLNVDTEYEMDTRIEVEPKKVVRVLAFAAGEENGDIGCVEPMEMHARYKRVREIMRENGCRVDEDLYGRQIRKALGRLKE
ncbi:hypothetical protein COCVIDRAFT_33160 [Bipolaris victoriae FI3]|uniref:Uncharacterized protein n=1 Tax=Bipolaris victoriae (strain FI3) TaxID=930091 RepID=W7F2B2_BIPV3|nr:hypothetical protein COCVIDRAFT_33160 [Bipolaris victoriae FI3]